MSGVHGDDNSEMSEDELVRLKDEMEKMYGNKNPWNWSMAILGGLIGGVAGTALMMYLILDTEDSAPLYDANGTLLSGPPPPPPSITLEKAQFEYSLGLLLGIVLGAVATMAYMGVRLIMYHRDDPFKKQVEAMREVVRKKEQMRIERHDEVIYYDAGTAHGCCFSFWCRPHYGKITSERVIYSAPSATKDGEDEPSDSVLKRICRCLDLRTMWSRKVESVDIEHMLDVGVSQTCMQMITNVGDVTIHLVAGSDTSIVKDERDKLLQALSVNPEKKKKLLEKEEETIRERIEDLKTALHTARDLQPLQALVHTAENEVKRLVDVGMKVAAEKQEEYYEPHPRPQTDQEKQDANAANKVVVKDVKRPYMVLDTMSCTPPPPQPHARTACTRQARRPRQAPTPHAHSIQWSESTAGQPRLIHARAHAHARPRMTPLPHPPTHDGRQDRQGGRLREEGAEQAGPSRQGGRGDQPAQGRADRCRHRHVRQRVGDGRGGDEARDGGAHQARAGGGRRREHRDGRGGARQGGRVGGGGDGGPRREAGRGRGAAGGQGDRAARRRGQEEWRLRHQAHERDRRARAHHPGARGARRSAAGRARRRAEPRQAAQVASVCGKCGRG